MPPAPGEESLVEKLTGEKYVPRMWERQPTDTEDSWAEFVKFRDTNPPRRLIRPGTKATATIYQWAKDHNWLERVAAYDRHLDGVKVKAIEVFLTQGAKEAAAERLAILKDFRELIALEAHRLLKAAQEPGPEGGPGLVKTADLVKLAELAFKYERLERGEVTEKTETTLDLGNLSIEELEKLDALASKADAKRG